MQGCIVFLLPGGVGWGSHRLHPNITRGLTKRALFTGSNYGNQSSVISDQHILTRRQRGEECPIDRADLLKKRPVSLADPSPAVFPLYMSQYFFSVLVVGSEAGVRRGLRVCVYCDSVPCWWRQWLKRRSRHLPDCWNVNAVALIIGFCTHRL